MSWENELAGEFRARDNRTVFQPQIGEVISVSPLRIALLSDAAILEAEQIYLCSCLAEKQVRKADISVPAGQFTLPLPAASGTGSVEGEGDLTFKECLSAGDLVACVPTAETPKFIVIDKVVGA